MSDSSSVEVAVLGGGCFWCTQAVFDQLRGVQAVSCGYCGGQTAQPTYERVCTGQTGHAECVRIEFDPAAISFADLLQVFFQTHDPTTLNRQGNDVGTQYRSVIFCQNEAQRQVAEETIRQLSEAEAFDGSIVTQVEPSQPFYVAESYHQDYFANNPAQPYCSAVIRPKMDKFLQRYRDLLKDPS